MAGWKGSPGPVPTLAGLSPSALGHSRSNPPCLPESGGRLHSEPEEEGVADHLDSTAGIHIMQELYMTSSNLIESITQVVAEQQQCTGYLYRLSVLDIDRFVYKEPLCCFLVDSDVQRPKRRCRSLSVSYQEPSLVK